jgi:hypothetical protein
MIELILAIIFSFILGFLLGKGNGASAYFWESDAKFWRQMWSDADKRADKYFKLLTKKD